MRTKIIYVGPGRAGRWTSLRSAIASSGAVNVPHIASGTLLSFETVVDGKVAPVLAGVSAARAWLGYTSARDLDLDPRIRLELGWIGDADGFVFVVDSRPQRLEASVEAYERLCADLRSLSRDIRETVVVFQLNRRDASDALSLDVVRRSLPAAGGVFVESVATKNLGTVEALGECIRGCRLRQRM